MSWSLRLQNGDLVVDEGKLSQVTGIDKLVQDLRAHFLERMGTDPLHPRFGSVLDGGTRPDGTEIPSVIGDSNASLTKSFVSNEIDRIIQDHQEKQFSRSQDDRIRYNKTTFTEGEFLDSADVQILQVDDTLMVRITLRAGDSTRSFQVPFLV